MRSYILSLLLVTIFFACNDNPPTTPETRFDETPNESNTDLYDVDEDDPYELADDSFMGMRPGSAIADFQSGLRDGVLSTGEGDFDVYYIDGAEGNELGYLIPDPADETKIGDIYITSPDVVTRNGIRVGNSYSELVERLGPVEAHGSEIEGWTSVTKDGLSYRLDMNEYEYEIDESKIDPNTKILEIIIGR